VTDYPGSVGEHALQQRCGSEKRAGAFYKHQVLDRLSESMQEFVPRQTLMFVATADAQGECDCSIRGGPEGQLATVIDERTLAYPEYRGNGVMASLGNISENPHIGILFVDFFDSTVGLHVNGKAVIVDNDELASLRDRPRALDAALAAEGGLRPERWVWVTIEEAYIHCSKHIPLLERLDKSIHWGTDDAKHKGGDYFRVKHEPRPWREPGRFERLRQEPDVPVEPAP
jgi:predicted pyridoxine 5'-phosphate oxidase superfamily flavin-nucleotide-binding protein